MSGVGRLVQLLTALAVVGVVVPGYWDIFPYVHWYYQHYTPHAPLPGQYDVRHGQLVDRHGRLRLRAVNKVSDGYITGKSIGPNVCYQCASSRDAYVYNMVKVPKSVMYPFAPEGRRQATVYVTKFARSPERRVGWGDCQNSFPHQVAGVSAIRAVTCMGRCYVKLGNNKEVTRGCAALDPVMAKATSGCHKSSGETYCICDGTRCNNQSPPTA